MNALVDARSGSHAYKAASTDTSYRIIYKDYSLTSSRNEIRDAILAAINEDKNGDLRRAIMDIPDKVADTVQQLTPVDTGTAKASIEVQARKTAYKRLSTRRIKIGEVYSDDDPAKIATLEYGRGASDDNGPTEEFAMFRRAAALWDDVDL